MKMQAGLFFPDSIFSLPLLRGLSLAVVAIFFTPTTSSFAQSADTAQSRAALDWQIELSHSILSSRDFEFFLRVRVMAATDQSEYRQPLNLVIVFDRSGSMKEESKIGYLQQAGHLVTDHLTKRDHVALVAYNDRVQVLVPMHRVVNKAYLHHRIEEVFAKGHTNLSGGLLEGCAQLHNRLDQPGLHHVILLTDGLANRGVTNANSLVRLVGRCTQRGITVTTIGVGTEYNGTLLSRIAQAGGGRYAHVSKPDKIPDAFRQELGALLAVVAQNTRLKLKLPSGVTARQVFGRETPPKPSVVEIPLGDLTSGDARTMLIKLRTDAKAGATGPIDFRTTLTYDDIQEAQRIELEQTVSIQRARSGVVARKTSHVLAFAHLVEAVDRIALAVHGMDRKVAAEVLEFYRHDFPALKQIARDSREQDFYNKAFMFEHYVRDLQDLIKRGALHEHSKERAALQKELHYRRYQMEHRGHHHQ